METHQLRDILRAIEGAGDRIASLTSAVEAHTREAQRGRQYERIEIAIGSLGEQIETALDRGAAAIVGALTPQIPEDDPFRDGPALLFHQPPEQEMADLLEHANDGDVLAEDFAPAAGDTHPGIATAFGLSDEQAAARVPSGQWCDACASYHHPDNPTCIRAQASRVGMLVIPSGPVIKLAQELATVRWASDDSLSWMLLADILAPNAEPFLAAVEHAGVALPGDWKERDAEPGEVDNTAEGV